MQLIEVNNTTTAKAFIEINVLLNKADPNYIRPLDKEINEVFDKEKNKSYAHGNAIRWVLKAKDGCFIGRIAAFTNKKYITKGTGFPVGCIGYFDCINDQTAANLLFDVAKKWLQNEGMEAMDGPVNFGNRDKWWGLMVEGFDESPMYGMSFNPVYYKQLMENYGFQNYYNQFYYKMGVQDKLPDRFLERYLKFKSKPGYVAQHINLKNLEKYAEDFATVYNAAWAQHEEAKEISKEQVAALFKQMKPVLDERFIWFTYHHDAPIAMWINIPDLNEYFKHFNGKLGLWQKLRLLWMKRTGVCKKYTGIAFGVVPKYQALGVDSFMIYEGAKLIKAQNMEGVYEMGWAGDWNPKMLNVYKGLEAKQSRKMTTYRYLFDRNSPFERHPIIGT